jgi:hypothetical protein
VPIEPSASPDAGASAATPTILMGTPSPDADPSATPAVPDPEAVTNPLTGLPVADEEALRCGPILISVANFPPSARPQSGLSFAAQVWETFIGEGMTRFLAVYYGDHLARFAEAADNPLTEGTEDRVFTIGPIRSGRVVYSDIKGLYPGAQLVAAGASAEVAEELLNMRSVFGSNPDDINSARLGEAQLEALCGPLVDASDFETLQFAMTPPAGGKEAASFRIIYNLFNQIGWEFDPAQGSYLRSQDTANGTGQLVPLMDRLTGEQLAFENVLVLWVPHRYETSTIIRIGLLYMRNLIGLLFRDGMVYEIRGSTRSGELQFTDEAGHVIPLKPGRTLFEVVSYETTWKPDQGIVRFHNPPAP